MTGRNIPMTLKAQFDPDWRVNFMESTRARECSDGANDLQLELEPEPEDTLSEQMLSVLCRLWEALTRIV